MEIAERGGGGCCPYFDPDYDSLTERINAPRVCVDNDAREDCTLVKVDSANRNGILLEMVQFLTDLDLVIWKSYISSDGGWLMDVFHVTDQLGKKVTNPDLICFIQQCLVRDMTRQPPPIMKLVTCLGRSAAVRPFSADYTSLELLVGDSPGLLSQISDLLVEAGYDVAAAEAWSHNSFVAMLIFLTEHSTGKPISDKARLTDIEEMVGNVVIPLQRAGRIWKVRVVGPGQWLHTERRLHQLLHQAADYQEEGSSNAGNLSGGLNVKTQVSIGTCTERSYSVVNIISRDRPKLLFDTVCALTDMNYVVFHATVSSHGLMAIQEYFVRKMDGCVLESENERNCVARFIQEAIEHRPYHGLGFRISTVNRTGLLSDITKVFREQGLTLTRVEIGTRDELAVGAFFLTDASGNRASPDILEHLNKFIDGSMILDSQVTENVPTTPPLRTTQTSHGTNSSSDHLVVQQRGMFSLEGFSWLHFMEHFSKKSEPIYGRIR